MYIHAAAAAMVMILGTCSQLASAQDKYLDKYDNIDLDEILSNDRLYKKYFDCLTGEGKCTPDGKDLKDVLPDALQTGCVKCSEKQKAGSERIVKFILEKKPGDFSSLEMIYDPEGVYKQKYKVEAQKIGIKI